MQPDANNAITRSVLPCAVAEAWKKVRFYEHITTPAPWLLRVVLPTPVRTQGCHGQPGDVSRCRYSNGGYLTKHITAVHQDQGIEFDIIEQNIRYHTFVKLLGGHIRVKPHARGTLVEMHTRFRTHRWLAPLIAQGIKLMHRTVMRDMYACLPARALMRHHDGPTLRHDRFVEQ